MESKFEFKSCTNDHQKIVKLLGDFSLETTPFVAEKIGNFSDFIRPSTTIFITFLYPGEDGQQLEDYHETIEKLKVKAQKTGCTCLATSNRICNMYGETKTG